MEIINEGRRQKAAIRARRVPRRFSESRQKVVFVTGIYAPIQKIVALKGKVLDLIVWIKIDL
jgi:hypothetical protein